MHTLLWLCLNLQHRACIRGAGSANTLCSCIRAHRSDRPTHASIHDYIVHSQPAFACPSPVLMSHSVAGLCSQARLYLPCTASHGAFDSTPISWELPEPVGVLFAGVSCMQALAVGIGLLRVVPLVLFFVFSKLAGTERAKYRLWAKQPYEFGANVANHSIVILLGLAFTVLAPLIAPFCLLYFTLALLAQKYQLIYVFTLPYNASGRMWRNVGGLNRSSFQLALVC